jgi:O-antigen/teichoic acid export membrane protein
MWVKILQKNIIYAIGSVANSAALFLLIPFLVNVLSPAEYGAWSIYDILILLLGILISAGMDIGLMREYWFLENDGKRSRLSGTVLMGVTIWGIALFCILLMGYGLVNRSPIFVRFHLEAFSSNSLLLVYLIAFSETLFTVLLAIFRIREQAVHFVALSVGKMILFMVLAILGEKLTGNINGALAGRLLAALAGIIVASIFISPIVRLKFEWNQLKRVLRYGLPLIPANLSSYILLSSDRYILAATSTLTTVATYSFAYKLASGLDVLITRPFATDWAARRYRIATQEDARTKYAEILIIYLFISSLAVSGLIALSPMIYKLVAPASYIEGIKVLPILVFAIQIYGLSIPLNVGLVIKDMTPMVAKIGIVSAIFCVAIELWLIPHYGMAGAAWSTLLSYVVWTGGVTILSLRVYPIRYNLSQIISICLATVISYVGLRLILQNLANVSIGSLLISLSWLVLVYGITGLTLLRKFPAKAPSKA